MGHVNEIRSENLSPRQFEVVQGKLLNACDRMCDAQVLDLADALHAVIRSRQRIRCAHTRLGGDPRPVEPRTF